SKPGAPLNGNWKLTELSLVKTNFEELFPSQKPSIVFEEDSQKVHGHTGCNRFCGKVTTNGSQLGITETISMTKEACQGKGEELYLKALKAADNFKITEQNQLKLFNKETLLLVFEQRP
ncbi:MAG TPA: META domain-containing protein, partial [Cytophagales bacterium]|nr:META domain-containing protein [Cytophagales bacterium]